MMLSCYCIERFIAERNTEDGAEPLSFPRDLADGNHAAAPSIRSCYHNPYRQNPLLFFSLCYQSESRKPLSLSNK